MRRILKAFALSLVFVMAVAAGLYLWVSSRASDRLARTYETHRVDLPVPFPLSAAEVAQLDPLAETDLARIALDRAVARGQHLTKARYACAECHGVDFGGGTMVDDPAVGQLFGPNLTGGAGSRVGTFTVSDWDRLVRHGVGPDGRPSVMPSHDFFAMSDRELSDMLAYIRSLPPVDRTMPPVALGPVMTVMVGLDQARISAELHPDHTGAHLAEPPTGDDPLKLGQHLAQTCTGCHNAQLSGGPIPGAPPEWPPAANLTPHADGLADWTYDSFAHAMRTGELPDGTRVRAPMAGLVSVGQAMTDAELQATWSYLATLPPRADEG